MKSVNKAQENALALLHKCGALLFGEFILTSKKKSDYYFDSKQLTLDPEGAEFVAGQLVQKLEEEDIEVVGGTAYSAIPIASHVCLYSRLKGKKPIRAFYIRKETKGHGTNQLAEGKVPPPGVRVAILEDVVTTGGSLLEAIRQATNQGCTVTHAMTLIDRNEGGRQAVEAEGYKFWALFTVCRTPEGKLDIRFNGV